MHVTQPVQSQRAACQTMQNPAQTEHSVGFKPWHQLCLRYQLIFFRRRLCIPLNCAGLFARLRAEARERRDALGALEVLSDDLLPLSRAR